MESRLSVVLHWNLEININAVLWSGALDFLFRIVHYWNLIRTLGLLNLKLWSSVRLISVDALCAICYSFSYKAVDIRRSVPFWGSCWVDVPEVVRQQTVCSNLIWHGCTFFCSRLQQSCSPDCYLQCCQLMTFVFESVFVLSVLSYTSHLVAFMLVVSMPAELWTSCLNYETMQICSAFVCSNELLL